MAVEQNQTVVAQPQASSMSQAPQTEVEQKQDVQPKGWLSSTVMRLRGGDGHHPFAECCCCLCIMCGLEELCCIGIVDSCLGFEGN